MRKRAVEAERTRLLIEAWGFDTFSMNKTQIIERLQSPDIGCSLKSRKNPTGDFRLNFKKNKLLQLLHSKLKVPVPHESVDSFIAAVQFKSKDAGKRAVLAMSTTAQGNEFVYLTLASFCASITC